MAETEFKAVRSSARFPDQLIVELSDGTMISVPHERLADARPPVTENMGAARLSEDGKRLIWDEARASLTFPQFLVLVFGANAINRARSVLGGRGRSAVKTAQSRLNARQPRK